ncbi:MAG: hypothetical protein ACRCS0_13940 [Albidovulum sp.]|jgi:hypothetical protein
MTNMRSLTALAVALALSAGTALSARAASLDGLAVDVINESEEVLCAEKDNVAIAFANKDVRSFRIEAAHPVYLSAGMRDNFEADWTACDMSADPSYVAPGQPRKVTLYEETEMWVVGYAFPAFWRPSTAKVRIGDRVEEGLHLLQVWLLRTDGAEEVLVLYPQDGYWRPRPMTPPTMRNTGYGSSFLVGPIDREERPHVKFKEVSFDPKTRTFTLQFEKGGSATVRMAKVDSNRMALDVAFDKGIENGPFAMLRSMYVTEFNNDMARVAVREREAKGWREENIMQFKKAHATDIWMGRLSPSQHNTSSPDVVFNSFSDGPYPKRPKSEPPPTIVPKKAE